MSADLPKSYSPGDSEGEVRARWEAARAFHADPVKTQAEGLEPFCIVIPPPNVTAALHLGHAFNNTLQDVLVRYHRMTNGTSATLWMPGTDHAGIATQAVVEKRLLLQGKRRTDFSRDEFIAIVQEWKDEYEATIIAQLKAMGCSCDFDRTRFTMDEVCAKAVREAFFRLFKDGLIYRGKRLVNWDPVSQTALADDEVEMEEVQGHMWYLRYPVVDAAPVGDAHGLQSVGVVPITFVTVATTRPETMLGDTAVAMNPRDPRAPHFVGKFVKLPIVDRVIPIIADDYVVRPVEYGGDENDPKAKIATGFLKVTPAHDPNDYEIGQRHNLPLVNVFAPDATISDAHGWIDVNDEAKQFLGLSREDARAKVVEWFKARGLLEAVKPYTHSVGHSYRSHVPIEPYLSDQWYVKVTDDRMKGEALRALAREQVEGETPPPLREGAGGWVDRSDLEASPNAVRSTHPLAPSLKGRGNGPPREGDGELRFFPARYAKTFQTWHENLRDWCISRQLWWGHRIPVWTYTFEGADVETSKPFGRGEALTLAMSDQDGLAIGTIDELDDDYHDDFCFQGFPWGYVFDDAGKAALGANVLRLHVCVRWDNPTLIQRLEAAGFERDPDVLDTWFSSGLWPISTMGWPDPEAFPNEIPEGSALLETFNPSSVLCTAREIITLWVSRMVMFNRYFREGKLPFRDVYIHAMIQDGHGQKMSKSLGNGVDPRDIIHSHGSDAMRFVMTKLATATQDVRLPVDTVCPAPQCEETFQPKEITTPAGYHVADVMQTCPKCGKKMISGYGAATGLAAPAKETPLARNSSRKFDEGRNFANKLYQVTLGFAVRVLSQAREAHGLQSVGFDLRELPLVDRWIISRLHRTLHAVEDALKEYQFNAYADAMYDFIWRDFCDWYVEAIKPTVKSNPAQQQVLRTTLNALLRLLHPIMPFVTETLWTPVNACAGGAAGLEGIELPPSDLLAIAAWPDIRCSVDDEEAVTTFERIQNLVNAIRTLRAERQVQKKTKITLHTPHNATTVIELIAAGAGVVETLADLKTVEVLTAGAARPPGAVPLLFEGHELLLSGLTGDVADAATERARLTKVIEEKTKAVATLRARLENPGYLTKAPPDKVEETRQMLRQAEADLAAAKKGLESLP